MSSTATAFDIEASPCERMDAYFAEIGELTGQRNAIDARLVQIAAEIDRDGLWGATGARSMASLMAWKTGVSPRNAEVMVAVAHRLEEFPRCAEAMRQGRLSLDQVGVVAEHAGEGSDEHYAQFAESATVTQLRTAVKLEPRPEPDPKPEVPRSIAKTSHDDGSVTYKIRLPKLEAAKFDAALASHQDALVADWKRDHEDTEGQVAEQAPPFPNGVDAFMSVVEAGWDSDVKRRPHGQRTTVVVQPRTAHGCTACGVGAHRGGTPTAVVRCDVRGVAREARAAVRGRPVDPHHQSAVAPRAGAPGPVLPGSRVRGHPGLARPPHHSLGERRGHRAAPPGAGVPVPSPPAPQRHHHHHRTGRPAGRHRRRGPPTRRRLPRPATHHAPP